MTNQEAMIPLPKSAGGGRGGLIRKNPGCTQVGSGLLKNVKIILLQKVAAEGKALIMAA